MNTALRPTLIIAVMLAATQTVLAQEPVPSGRATASIVIEVVDTQKDFQKGGRETPSFVTPLYREASASVSFSCSSQPGTMIRWLPTQLW